MAESSFATGQTGAIGADVVIAATGLDVGSGVGVGVGSAVGLPVRTPVQSTFTVTVAVSEHFPVISMTVYVNLSWPQKLGEGT